MRKRHHASFSRCLPMEYQHFLAATLVNSVQRETTETCRHGSYAAWLLLWRFRSQWKRLLSKQSNKTRYNYDAQSYSRNFDNGCSDDNPSPLAPRTSFGIHIT